MKILYLTTPEEDYLQDQMLIGLRQLYGADTIDYPKKDILYKNFDTAKEKLYGRGFTIWKTIDDINVDRDGIIDRIKSNDISTVIFGSIWRQKQVFDQFLSSKLFSLNNVKYCFIDGQDHSRIFWPAIKHGHYYKRELRRPLTWLFAQKINFSIPNSKIRPEFVKKENNFATHVQCEEAYKIDEIKNNCVVSYAFDSEDAYYHDIAISRYAITMKKGGWDCMRHYEIAANGTVPCFYQLAKKPRHCAPHDLIDMHNCIVFNTAEELTDKISQIDVNNHYTKLQLNAYQWAKNNSCKEIAQNFMDTIPST